ncbi:MAG TPA: hypothetical protein VNL17_10315 [Verrucomicrobiae bacterium]|nr:hypothetical protein [Verrucomicrobiae bacterium]
MSDVFILGAGFSKAIFSQMLLLPELSDEVEKFWLANNRRPAICDLFRRELELWLSFLLEDHPWLMEAENLRNRALGLDALGAIKNRLFVREEIAVGYECPTWFTQLVEYWRTNSVSVFTLNYDSLVERCAASLGIKTGNLYPVPLTPSGQRLGAVLAAKHTSTFRLFKLHGSGSWFYSGSEFARGETIYYIPYTGWSQTPAPEDPMVASIADKAPLIVPPRFNKGNYLRHETVHQLWTRASYALQAAKRVFVLGYSLPPTDLEMRYFLATNTKNGSPAVYVVDKNPEIIERFAAVFNNPSINQQFVYDGEPIPAFVDALTSEQL